ncbi:MAG TPA: ferrochelatase [Acidimicrobiales bacterium]|nr:ferrochelatase [Acidimicrobiales bacterium]
MTTGVLVLSHGTPATREGVEPFYTAIRRGQPPTPELLADLQRRYDAIGGTSPLAERTRGQVEGIARALEGRAPGRHVVEGATKYSTPRIEAAVESLVARGVDVVVGLVLSPLRAPMSTDQYHDRATAAIAGRVPYRPIWSWWRAPGFAELLGARVRDEVAACASVTPLVAFSAHSLPLRALGSGTDYPGELAGAADATARAAGVGEHVVCWQSAGRTGDAWLGPDVLELLGGLDAEIHPDVVVCPVGFVADHLEVLFDLDIEAEAVAHERGLTLRRTASLNDDPTFCGILADVVEAASA